VTFCPACGFAVAPTVFATFPVGYAPMAPTTPTFGPADGQALRYVEIAAILALLSAVASVIGLFSDAFSTSFTVGSTANHVTISATDILLVVATVAVALVEVWLYREAFKGLTPTDSRFRTPALLTLLIIPALVVLIGLYAWTLELLLSFQSCAGTTSPVPSSCVPVALLVAAVLLLAVAVVALVGYIGMIIGIWRLGTRYDDTKFKVGAILLIFPVLNLVGAILILVAAHEGRRVHSAAPPVSFT
jgi:hypothetical protein